MEIICFYENVCFVRNKVELYFRGDEKTVNKGKRRADGLLEEVMAAKVKKNL